MTASPPSTPTTPAAPTDPRHGGSNRAGPTGAAPGGGTGRPADDLWSRPPVVARWIRPLIHVLAFVRKETIAVLRQPILLAVLVIGPFLLLFLFALGYDQEQTVLRTMFVGPADSVYEDATARFDDDLSQYLVPAGYTTDLVEAQDRLSNDEIDLIVVFPPEPAETVLGGEQASITVLHDKLDPIQQTAVDVSAQVAVQELNSQVLEDVLGEVQTSLRPYQESADEATALLADLEDAVAASDQAEIRRLAAELDRTSGSLQGVVDATDSVRRSLGDELEPADQERFDALVTALERYDDTTGELVAADGDVDAADVRQTRLALESVAEQGDTVVTLDPAVAVRPFTSESESLLRESVSVNDFFAPAAIALLVQHMALTFAALGLVRDRTLGLFELYRVGPIRSGRILLGKYLAHLLIGSGVAAALLAAVVTAVDVPLRGQWWWVAIGIVGLVTASIAAGMILSLLAGSDSQAVQFAMLALLAGLFFGGFLLELDAIRYPVKAISFLLPVTYGTTLLRDVMLRGASPELLDLVGLTVTSIVYGLVGWWLMARRLRLGAS
ncbi:MAG: ABC transporter permease [Acidimicrobiales bacterium]